MKKILLYAGLVAALATTGATCINEDITIPVNVPPMTASIPLGSGSTTNFNGNDHPFCWLADRRRIPGQYQRRAGL